VTGYDRYPALFAGVQSLAAVEDMRVLSFGCSTGEEVETLARYFPTARIVGADVAPFPLRRAERRCRNLSNVSLVNSARVPLADLALFDVVFALSVLCRYPETRDLVDSSGIYPFEGFEQVLDELAGLLARNGLLVIYNSNYRFTDSRTAKIFEPVEMDGLTESGFVPKFGPTGQRLKDQEYPYCAFRKIRD